MVTMAARLRAAAHLQLLAWRFTGTVPPHAGGACFPTVASCTEVLQPLRGWASDAAPPPGEQSSQLLQLRQPPGHRPAGGVVAQQRQMKRLPAANLGPWRRVRDAASGGTYWHNTATGAAPHRLRAGMVAHLHCSASRLLPVPVQPAGLPACLPLMQTSRRRSERRDQMRGSR